MDFHALFSFAGATFVETITPGPTLALLIESRTRSRSAAIATVIGITLANIVWILLILALGSWLTPRAEDAHILPILRNVGAAYLILLATRRVLSATIHLISAAQTPDQYQSARDDGSFIWAGFAAHFLNPVTPPYYLSAFGLVVSDKPVEVALLFGGLPIIFDLVAYLLVACVSLPRFGDSPAIAIANGTCRLLAASLLLYLVAHTLSADGATSSTLKLPGITALLVLLGFLAGAVSEAYYWVGLRAGLNNKVLWRVVALWSSWFSAIALLGGLYALIDALNSNAIPIGASLKAHLRICFIVAAGMAASLSLAKAFGEIKDELLATPGSQKAIAPGWIGHPLKAGLGALAFVLVVLLILRLTDFQVT
jgi:threonine/homoserine/homoserine lactone efflux protein